MGRGIREPYYLKRTVACRVQRVKHSGQRDRLVPHLLELCGIDIPKKQKVDGVNLVPILSGNRIRVVRSFGTILITGNQVANRVPSSWKVTETDPLS